MFCISSFFLLPPVANRFDSLSCALLFRFWTALSTGNTRLRYAYIILTHSFCVDLRHGVLQLPNCCETLGFSLYRARVWIWACVVHSCPTAAKLLDPPDAELVCRYVPAWSKDTQLLRNARIVLIQSSCADTGLRGQIRRAHV